MNYNLVGRLLNADFATAFFEKNLPKINLGDYRLLSCSPAPLKLSKTGGKSVLAFRLQLQGVQRAKPISTTIIGTWRPDQRNQRVFQLLQKLWLGGFNGKHRNKIPEPLAYLKQTSLLFTSQARGRPLEEIMIEGHDSLEPSIARTAHWIAKLHKSRIKWPRTHSARQDRQTLDTWVDHFRKLQPKLAGRTEDLVAEIIAVEESLSPNRFVLTHGDYHPENIFVGPDQVTGTDFERSIVSDPATDLGYFIAQVVMKTWKGKYHPSLRKRVGTLCQLFLQEYQKRTGLDLTERVPAYEARAYLEILHYIYWGLAVAPNIADFRHWVRRAEEVLQS